jgi:DNA polymerase/3'-5' exonuclease PolX
MKYQGFSPNREQTGSAFKPISEPLSVVRGLSCRVSEIFNKEGIDGLEKVPGVGETIARSIRDILLHGKLAMLERLRGEHDPPSSVFSVRIDHLAVVASGSRKTFLSRSPAQAI